MSNTLAAPNFALWDQTVSVSHPTYGGGAVQHQRSELLPDKITVLGDASVFRPAMVGTGVAEARSITSVDFTLSTPTDVALTASGVISGTGLWGPRKITLTGPGTSINWDFINGAFPDITGSRSTTATLLPGTYHFTVDLNSINSSITSVQVSSFNVSLSEVPEPGCLALIAIAPTLARRRRGHHGQMTAAHTRRQK